MAAKMPSKGRTQPVVSVKCVNWVATSLKNVREDALVSGKMSAFPIRRSLDAVCLEIQP